MNLNLASRGENIEESLTLAMTAKANKMKADGIKVISFSAGEPDFNTPQYIIDAAIDALHKGFTKYTPSSGILSLKKIICEKFLKDNNLTYEPKQIVISNGAKHSLYNAMLALINKGDEVIIPAPYWLTYPELVKLADGVPVFVKTTEEENFKLTPKKLKNAITSKTKAIIINSPSNPTGSVYLKEELIELGKIIEEANIYVISDEIYEKLIYDENEHISIASLSPALKERTIVINGVSKTYSMTGWRIGYLAAAPKIAKIIDNMQSHTTSNANSIAQYATLAALQGGEEFLDTLVHTFDDRRKYILERINKIKNLSALTPEGAFYVMLNISKLLNKKYKGEKIVSAQRMAELLLEAKHVVTVPGEAFGADEYLRLSYAIGKDDIKLGIDLIEEFVKEVN